MKKFYIGTGLWVQETSTQLPGVVAQVQQYCGNHTPFQLIPVHLGRAALSILLRNHNYDELTSPKALQITSQAVLVSEQ